MEPASSYKMKERSSLLDSHEQKYTEATVHLFTIPALFVGNVDKYFDRVPFRRQR